MPLPVRLGSLGLCETRTGLLNYVFWGATNKVRVPELLGELVGPRAKVGDLFGEPGALGGRLYEFGNRERQRRAGDYIGDCSWGHCVDESYVGDAQQLRDERRVYRQAEIYARQGIRLDRATLGNWSGRACFHLQPAADHMRRHLERADRLFMDETTAPVLDPGRGQTKKGYFWAIVSDHRGHSGLDRSRSIAGAVDARALLEPFAAALRRFVKLARNSKSPIAEAAVQHIAQLYAIEAMVRGSSPDIRLAARREHSLPMVAALKPWFEKQLSMISSGSTLAEDIRYALNHWQGLTRFLEDRRLELDTNPVENAIRPICLTRKNALFAGHEVGAENWALLASIVRRLQAQRHQPGRLHCRNTRDNHRRSSR
ncbi:IS66 family transposase [Bradyrhizobium sp. 35]|uniref:IS66 family transposase n=1 Tax=Bradyrhizobium sp. 35 TaxID=2782670 RepID=UPI001FF7A077